MQILPTVKEALLLVLRAHLMLFYFEGAILLLDASMLKLHDSFFQTIKLEHMSILTGSVCVFFIL